jgi:acyl-CoA thioesterase FadM
MQQAGIEAAASVGYTDKVLFSLNRTWIPRVIVIEYLQPVRYGTTLEVKTWVDGVRRVLSRRRYEFRKRGEAEPVATAFTDWVFVDLESGLPVTIPENVMSAFYPEGIPNSDMKRTPFPDVAPAPPGIFQVNRRVEWGYTDPMNHLNNAAYLTITQPI